MRHLLTVPFFSEIYGLRKDPSVWKYKKGDGLGVTGLVVVVFMCFWLLVGLVVFCFFFTSYKATY